MGESNLKERIENEFAPRAAQLEKEHTTLRPQTQAVVDAMSDALRAKNRPLIERLLADLTAHVPFHADLLARVRQLNRDLATLSPQSDGDAKKVGKLTKSMGELEGKLETNFKNLKKMQDMANDAVEGTRAAGAAMEEWADMESWLTKSLEAAKLRLEQMELLIGLVRDAVEEGDAAELEKLQKRNEERTKWRPTQKEVEERFAKFCTACEAAGLEKSLVDQLTRDRAKFKKMVDELHAVNAKIDGWYTAIQVQKAKTAPPKAADPKKAAALLKIPNSHVAKLEKALAAAGPARVSKLDALADELELKIQGKAMLAALEKAKLV